MPLHLQKEKNPVRLRNSRLVPQTKPIPTSSKSSKPKFQQPSSIPAAVRDYLPTNSITYHTVSPPLSLTHSQITNWLTNVMNASKTELRQAGSWTAIGNHHRHHRLTSKTNHSPKGYHDMTEAHRASTRDNNHSINQSIERASFHKEPNHSNPRSLFLSRIPTACPAFHYYSQLLPARTRRRPRLLLLLLQSMIVPTPRSSGNIRDLGVFTIHKPYGAEWIGFAVRPNRKNDKLQHSVSNVSNSQQPQMLASLVDT